MTFPFICVPAKYSIPGRPNSFGDAVNVCHIIMFAPSAKELSAVIFNIAGYEDQCRFMWVKASTAARLFP